MQFGKAILTGIVLWAVMFAVASIVMALGLSVEGTLFSVLMTVIWLVLIWWVVMYWYKPTNIADAFVVGLVWLIIAALLDYFVLVSYFRADMDPATYYTWGIWLYYAIALLFPSLLKSMTK